MYRVTGCLVLALFAVCLVVYSPAGAQPPRTRPGGVGSGQPQPSGQAWPRTRTPSASRYDDANVRARALPTFSGTGPSGTGPASRIWRLGIYDARAPRGIMITNVSRGTPAAQIGLESGDYILDVSGYVVGEYRGVFYPLALAMDYGADPNGWAELLIWNKRTYQEETRWVRFLRR